MKAGRRKAVVWENPRGWGEVREGRQGKAEGMQAHRQGRVPPPGNRQVNELNPNENVRGTISKVAQRKKECWATHGEQGRNETIGI